jgi:hypothetical protein
MKIQRKKGKHTAIGGRHMAIIFWLFEGTLENGTLSLVRGYFTIFKEGLNQ